LVLELPGEGEELEVLMIPEDCEIREVIEAQFVIGSFEIAVEDVLLPPRPFVLQLVVALDFKKKSLYFAFKTPEACATEYIVLF
jgi:hypothetical protein